MSLIQTRYEDSEGEGGEEDDEEEDDEEDDEQEEEAEEGDKKPAEGQSPLESQLSYSGEG